MNKSAKWRVTIALVLLYIAIIVNSPWLWIPLLLIWVIPDLFSVVTHFVEPVERMENPILYWLIMLTWLGMTSYSIILTF